MACSYWVTLSYMTTPGNRIASVAPNSRKAEITHGVEERDRSFVAGISGISVSPRSRQACRSAVFLFAAPQ
jgi:hypothetical protein